MKYAKIIRVLGIALILSLLMIAVPAAPAHAWYDILLLPAQGEIGDTITVSGTAFIPTTNPADGVVIYFSDQLASAGQSIGTHVTRYRTVLSGITTGTTGTFVATFNVPTTFNDTTAVAPGTHYLYVCQPATSLLILNTATFTVTGGISGEISIDPDKGPVDTLVEITGEGFAADEEIIIEFDGDEVDIEDGDDETDSSGEFSSDIFVPESDAGAQVIKVIVGTVEVEADFTVESDIIISPQSGEAGTEVTISGTGFARRPKEVYVYFNNSQVALDIMDRQGSFNTSFLVPEGLTAGVYTIEAEDEDFNFDTASFTLNVPPPPDPTPPDEPEPVEPDEPVEPEPVEPEPVEPTPATIQIAPLGNAIGSVIVISAAGFTPDTTVTLTYDDTEVATATSDTYGMIVVTFKAPASKYGDHIIIASDGTNTGQVTFTVESTPPPTPPPLLPRMGAKVESPVTFDWNDVLDESSPVTYSLQIASDEDFTDSFIIFNITELEASEYTLTEMEELELAGLETAFYWRTRAVDAASNEGQWTGAGEFYMSTPFSFPRWALYTLLGIGAVIIFGIGYWLGRRTAFYY